MTKTKQDSLVKSDFEMGLESRNNAVAVAFFAGPAIIFDGMSIHMQNMFMQQLFEKGNKDFEAFISQHSDPSEWYVEYAHQFSLAVPVHISVAHNGEIVYSNVITDVQKMVNDLSSLFTMGESIYMYSAEEAFMFNRFLSTKKSAGVIVSDNDFEVSLFESISNIDYLYDTLDEHLCALELPIGEFIQSPHYVYVNAPDRMKIVNDTKALSFWKIANGKCY